MGGRSLTVDWARAEHTVSAEIMKTIANLFVRNIARGTTENDLAQVFGGEQAGVKRVKIQRTYGFVRFHRRAQAEIAMTKYNGAMLNGYRLEISWARPPPSLTNIRRTLLKEKCHSMANRSKPNRVFSFASKLRRLSVTSN
ncbi:APOB1 complementation factor [Parelaphostrongylus tenuis]|uniref:APOB1 complementation factor n=1 Tax=Parelaphostrongylus tenuis TaxID=148309 RepID=A0AAD5N3V1_PARTN|nr:APOB1 complementation factor [Parelaphostrongylus tenuis]